MKIVKNIFKGIGIFFTSLITLIVITLILLVLFRGAMYDDFYKNGKKTDVKIQGLDANYCPQGLDYDKDTNMYFFSGYMTTKEASRIYIYDYNNQSSKLINLANEDSSIFKGHIGGIAVKDNYVYLSNDQEILTINKERLINAENESVVTIDSRLKVNNEASFVFAGQDKLWVGEFYMKGKYETAESNHYTYNGEEFKAIVEGFDYDSTKTNGVSETSSVKISIPKKVQGFCITDSGKIALSISYAIVNSQLLIYDNVFETQSPKDNHYYLDKGNLLQDIAVMPMTEDLDYHNGKIYINFESASKKYKLGNIYPSKNVYTYDIK